jgi:[ribosomal protein S5]-alanine N-acetyltransferase
MLEGEKYNLRLFRESDLAEYHDHVSRISAIGEYWPIRLFAKSDLAKQFAADGFWSEDSGGVLITDKQDRLIGNINYFRGLLYTDGYELGYRVFRPEDRGKGIISATLPLFISYLFDLRPINRLQLTTDVDNLPSKRIAEKLGFKHEGVLRQCWFHRGKFVDIDIYSLLRHEWKDHRRH